MVKASINEASRQLGISPDTVRRRIKRGEFPAYKENGIWYVDVPQSEKKETETNGEVEALKQTIKVLQDELDARRREIQELHVLLRDTRALLPAPNDKKPWWRRLLPRH